MDQMEMIRRLIMLVGSGTGGSQAAALQLLLSSGNPALTFATPQLLSDQARIAALNSLQPSCAVDGTQSDPQTVLASLLNNSTGNGAFSSGEGAKDASSGVAARANATSTKAATDAHSVLSSFISKLTADSINGDTKHGAHKSKPVSSGSTVPLVNTSVPLPSTPKFTLITPSDAPNGVLLQPENTNDSTPENRGSTPGNKEQLSKQMYKPQSPALLNPLSLTSRPVNQWSTSDMDAVLNSPLFRTLPRMSFRPPTKRKLFDGFSAMNLSFKNMCKLRPLLKEWLEGQEAAVANGVNVEELRTIEIAKVTTVFVLLVCQFEYSTFKEKVEECVEEVPIHVSNSEPIMKRRRKRTNLDLSQAKKVIPLNLSNDGSDGVVALPEATEITTNPG
ncbi:hypothetical protein ANCCEY_02187 [Ancylostoma ceylanicum]|uniref:POU-specific domain-containing protein n=1 Tax=Ancylostoma ceylanicum TaxID=53326 RepID=A0A0D6M582_9BILA|nr:hypothetical protein ANCCEY_02187 [Ancylostoma ceylanicum]